MYDLTLNAVNAIPFVLVDSLNVELPGLGAAFTVLVAKNGGAFAPSIGSKAELTGGWYLYTAPVARVQHARPPGLTHHRDRRQSAEPGLQGAARAQRRRRDCLALCGNRSQHRSTHRAGAGLGDYRCAGRQPGGLKHHRRFRRGQFLLGRRRLLCLAAQSGLELQ